MIYRVLVTAAAFNEVNGGAAVTMEVVEFDSREVADRAVETINGFCRLRGVHREAVPLYLRD